MSYRAYGATAALFKLWAVTTTAYAATPKIDFDRMGKVAVAGSYAGIDLYDNQHNSPSFDAASSTIFLRSQDGALTPIGSTNPSGNVVTGCFLQDKFYFGGTFDSVSSQTAHNIISYSPSTSTFTALSGGGLDGPVTALHCDSSSKNVWVGGSFNGPLSGTSGYAGSVAVYTPSSDSWSPPPFAGLSGAGKQVATIVPNSDSSALLFGGSFIISYQSGSNDTLVNNPNVPQSTGSTPFTSSLVPFPLTGAEIVSSPSSSRPGLGDINNILCPNGPDGPGHTWFAREGSYATITVRAFQQLTASGLRLGNSFFDGQSTTEFCVTSIPDNQVLTLTYNVPGSDETKSCTDICPLSTDPTVAFQDFLFNSNSITGVLITLRSWTAEGAGLHILQLLSNGAFSPAVIPRGSSSCYAPGPSSVTTTGTWTTTNVFTSTPGTTQNVLTSSVQVGTLPPAGPSVTWHVYTSASGNYDVYLLIPGCVNMQNCDSRTSVDVTISPGGSMTQVTTTVSERNQQDARVLIYSGLLIPAPDSFTVPITLTISRVADGTGVGGRYIMVADRVIMELKSTADGNTNGGNGNGQLGGAKRGFGVFEYPLNGPKDINAANILPNTTINAFSPASFGLFSELGGSTANAVVKNIVSYSSDKTFIGGDFDTKDAGSNIVQYSNGAISAVANKGVNGPVSSMVLYGNHLFVAGEFSSTSSGGIPLHNIAQYDVGSNQWSSLGGGVDGAVAALGIVNGHLTVAGNFTHTLVTSNTGLVAAGFATWDINGGRWTNNGGLLAGRIAMITNATSNNDGSEYIAGRISKYLKYGADGLVSIRNGDNSNPEIVPLGARIGGSELAKITLRKRGGWGINLRDILARQTTGEIPPLPSSIAPSVLTGDFWTNTTSSRQVLIMGGNFSLPTSSGVGLAVYDPNDETVNALPGNQLIGVPRALLVVGSKLYVGGEFTVSGVPEESFAVYDLISENWVTSVPGLKASSGKAVVRSITSLPSKPATIVVAGSFSSAGPTQCNGICSFDTDSQTWAPLGSGVQGDVTTVSFAGNNGQLLLAAGALTLSGSAAQVASYSIENATWVPVGTLPGPVTAFSVNDRNESSVFAAGRTGSGPYFSHWDGVQWTTVDLPLSASSNVTHLEMVPVAETHDATGLIQSNRVLWMSGALQSTQFGDVSSALYDGQTLYPYLVTSTATGESGSISSFFHSFKTFSFDAHKFLATGVVILISIAIGAGIVFLLGLIGILWALFARRDDRNFGQDTVVDDDDSTNRPSSLLANVTAATRNTILGQGKEDYYIGHKGEETVVDDHVRTQSPVPSQMAAVGIIGGTGAVGDRTTVTTSDENDVNRPAHARYSFEGHGEGELPLKSGSQVIVLNDQDPTWWFVRDRTTQKEGIVPSSYLV